MKGIIFTEFLELVEEKFGLEMVDKIISENELASGGAYTSVGTYDHNEMLKMVASLSEHSSIDIEDLLVTYGEHLFGTFLRSYASFINNANNSFEFLESVDSYIHVEVKKLYHDAELPSFSASSKGNIMEMLYSSPRKLSAVAEGIILAALKHYKEEGSVVRDFLKEDGSEVKITISLE